MHSKIAKISLSFVCTLAFTLISLTAAKSTVDKPKVKVEKMCKKACRVEYFQNEKGQVFQLNYVDQNELSRFYLAGSEHLSFGGGECVPTQGNCVKVKTNHYQVVLPN